MNPLHMEVYEVKGVTGLLANRRGRRAYTPFYSFSHVMKPKGEQAFFLTRRAHSPIDDGLDHRSVGGYRQPQDDLPFNPCSQ